MVIAVGFNKHNFVSWNEKREYNLLYLHAMKTHHEQKYLYHKCLTLVDILYELGYEFKDDEFNSLFENNYPLGWYAPIFSELPLEWFEIIPQKVKAHTKKTKNGKVINVGEYYKNYFVLVFNTLDDSSEIVFQSQDQFEYKDLSKPIETMDNVTQFLKENDCI